MRGTPDLSVIIPAHNAGATLEGQLRALENQTCDIDWELILVNHRSTDQTKEIAHAYRDRLSSFRVLDFMSGCNPASARNFGATHARSDSLAFCDADDVVDTDWVQAMMTALEQNPLVAGRLDHSVLNPRKPPYMEEFQSRGVLVLFRIQSIVGANFGCHRALWERLGGMDEAFHTAEDFDFAIRARLHAAVEPTFAPNAVVFYRHRTGLRSIGRQSFDYGLGLYRVLETHADDLPIPPRLTKIALARLFSALKTLPRAAFTSDRPTVIARLGRAFGFSSGALKPGRNQRIGD